MARNPDDVSQQELNLGRLAAAAMIVSAVLLALVAVAWLIARVWEISQGARLPLAEFLGTATLLLAAWGLAALLWGVALSLRRLENALESVASRAAAAAPAAADGVLRAAPREAGGGEAQARLLEELVQLTREVRDIELLSEAERAMRLQAEGAELARRLEREVPALLREHDWLEARRRVQQARLRFPALPNWDALEQQVEAARTAVEAQDVEQVTREVNDLIALGAWDRALQAVRDAIQRHPLNARLAELARRVATGRERALAEERARLMAQAQEATSRREWGEALRRAELLLAKYPDSPEAEGLRAQLPTLRANAEIQVRQRLEQEYLEHVREHRYAEALRVARTVVEQYPGSPQAAALRDQLPRLEQKVAAVGR